MCQALDEMRACYKTYNFSPMKGLIEEVQSMGNRMEGALEDKNDLRTARNEVKELQKEIRKLKKKKAKLEEEK